MSGEDGPQTLERLTAVSGWPKSSLLRLLRSLEAFGAVRRDPATKTYHAKLRLMPTDAGRTRLIDLARPTLETLCTQTHQTIELYAWAGGMLTMIDRREPEDVVVAVRARIGFTRSLDELDALSQVVHAFADPVAPASYWVWRSGKRTELDHMRVQRIIEQARQRTVATDLGINSNGVRRYAAPSLHEHQLQGVIAVAQFCTPADRRPSVELRNAIRQAGIDITRSVNPAPALRAGYCSS